MKTNEGTADRIIRVIGGLGIVSLLALGPVPGWGLIGVIGLVPLVTGIVGFCPGYALLGIDTRGQTPREARGG
jgi:hypothetical protein